LRARPIAEKGAVAVSLRREIWPFIAAGKIKPVIDSTFPLADAAKAHARMETSAHVGKIVLTV
jgi:NADPH2:quinone reductase